MKTLTLAVCFLVVACLSGYAATTGPQLCTGNAPPPPGTSDVWAGGSGTGPIANTCPSLMQALGFATLAQLQAAISSFDSITVTTSGSYDSGVGSVTYTETTTLQTGVFSTAWSLNPLVNTGAGGFSQTSANNPQTSSITTGLTVTQGQLSFLATATSALTCGTGCSVSQTTEQKTVTYNYSTPTSTPEPTALSIIGVGLVGLGVLGRKARKSA